MHIIINAHVFYSNFHFNLPLRLFPTLALIPSRNSLLSNAIMSNDNDSVPIQKLYLKSINAKLGNKNSIGLIVDIILKVFS